MKRIPHHSLLSTLVLLLGMMAAPFAVSAQDASPEAAPSLLDGLGLTVLDVTVAADGVTSPAEVAAGPVQVVVNNTTEGFLTLDLVQLPEGIPVEDYMLVGDSEDGMIPEWAGDLVLAGYASVPPMSTGSIVLNLAPGAWTVVADGEADIAAPSADLTVTGDAPTDVDIAADFDLEYGEYTFSFPETMTAGPQIWHVSNVHTVPHHAIIFPVDRLYTADEVHDGFMGMMSGSPAADGFSMETSIAGPPLDLPVVTAGQEFWTQVDLAPGYYVAVCFIADPGTSEPHIMKGMISAFEVTGG